MITQVSTLQNAHQTLTQRLAETQKYLRLIEADSQQLSEELTRVQLLSLTDELTELPNRRAFIRRLEDEVGRVQRYGNNLPLVIIDIDSFKAINDQHGHTVGDHLLRYYAKEILSVFRHHDLVARYGGEEFAILLPNTDIEGAIRAVAKVQRRAAECTFNQHGQTIPVPTFSAGIASYLPGETPTDRRSDVIKSGWTPCCETSNTAHLEKGSPNTTPSTEGRTAIAPRPNGERPPRSRAPDRSPPDQKLSIYHPLKLIFA
ncbi:MAG: diguanylate cyclase [Halothiobacillaceae bacterium]|nr:MAG: diguanylate cyclase [Halothiobacillaceae bacterium]